LRAERKAGEFLEATVQRGGDRKSKAHRAPLVLSDLGVTRIESQRWQAIAAVPDDQFESDPKVWTQKRVAAELGVSQQAVAKWFDIPNTTSGKGNTPATAKPDARQIPSDPAADHKPVLTAGGQAAKWGTLNQIG
jgi:hypothetical protein